MTSPLLPLSIGAQVVSTVPRGMAASDVNRARGRLLGRERERQAAYQEQANRSIADALMAFRSPSAQYLRATTPPTIQPVVAETAVPMTTSPESVRKDYISMLKDALASGVDQARRGSRLAAGGRQMQRGGEAIRDLGLDLGTISNFAQGSQQALPFELQAANLAGAKYQTLADILSGGGRIATLQAMRG